LLGSLWFNSFSAGGGGPADAYELISTTVLGSSAASVTFSGLGTSAAAYKHLQIRMVPQVTGTSGADLKLRMNGVSSAGSYKDHYLYGFAGSVSSGSVYTDSIYVGSTYPVSEGALFAPSIIEILDQASTTKNKVIRVLTGKPRSTDAIVSLNSGVFLSTAAITDLTLLPPTGSFNTGSRFSLYGLK
jgi:hypothetical protein